jgi:hypothetical protein
MRLLVWITTACLISLFVVLVLVRFTLEIARAHDSPE